jgi:hypothetical protein
MNAERIIPRRLQDAVDRELESGERVLWIDMPIPSFFTPTAIGAFLFAIPWTAFAVFWVVMAAQGTAQMEEGGPGRAFPLFGIPFILIGLGMLSSPLWAYRKALRTVYVITDRRAITFSGGFSTTIRNYPPAGLHNVHRREKRNGSGDVLFAERTWKDSDGDPRREELGFHRIRNPKDVEQKLRILAEEAVRREQDES